MGTWVEDIILSLESLGGISSLSEIYKKVEKIRPEPHPKDLGASVRGVIEAHSSDSKVFKGKDLFYSVEGVGKGIWGLRKYLVDTPLASDIEEPAKNIESEEPNQPERIETKTYRILRDTKLARQLKLLHQNHCQLCGDQIELTNVDFYSEAHHIKPLGNPHNGPDVAGNIIILCPNHHVQLDYGAIPLNLDEIHSHPNHFIQEEYIDYHNNFYEFHIA